MNWNKENLKGKVLVFYDKDLKSLRMLEFSQELVEDELNYYETNISLNTTPWLLSTSRLTPRTWDFTLDLEGAGVISLKRYHFLMQYRIEKEKEFISDILNYVESYLN